MDKYMRKAIRGMMTMMLVVSLVVSFCAVMLSASAVYAEDGQTGSESTVCEHVWGEWIVTVNANYFEKGSKTRTCELCGETETAVINKLTASNKWVKHNGKKYYFNSKGKKVKGWNKIKSSNKAGAAVKWCWFDKSGVFKKAISKNTRNKWVKVGTKKFYFTSKKKPIAKGFRFIGSKLYYFAKDLSLVTGKFKASDGKTYKTTKAGNITGLPYYKKRYGTFIIIDISSQRLTYYRSSKVYLKADVVTGIPGNRATPTGTFSVRGKARNVALVGSTWNVTVTYWMPFIGSAYGMHDASWRSSAEFSNHNTYKTNGSHGCVNMRFKDAAKLYNKVTVGTPVIVQN